MWPVKCGLALHVQCLRNVASALGGLLGKRLRVGNGCVNGCG